jgi:tetratricopeptide (TPR) repeat protein
VDFRRGVALCDRSSRNGRDDRGVGHHCHAQFGEPARGGCREVSGRGQRRDPYADLRRSRRLRSRSSRPDAPVRGKPEAESPALYAGGCVKSALRRRTCGTGRKLGAPGQLTALGYVLYLARRYDEAATQLTRTLTIDPDFAQARRDLALVHLQYGRGSAALAELRRVAALNEGSTAAQAELAYGYAVSGDHTAARRLLALLERERATRYVPPDGLAMVMARLARSMKPSAGCNGR